MMEFVEKLLEYCGVGVNGTTKATFGAPQIDFKAPYARVTMTASIEHFTGFDITGKSESELRVAARGMGMSKSQIMFKVEVPLAISVIMGGVRIATVTGIGIATIAALIGAGGLGSLIYSGISMMNIPMITVGAVSSAILALFADFILGLVEKKLTSPGIVKLETI
jgi:ABC-type proline/glycine betaine transport system permease subunit